MQELRQVVNINVMTAEQGMFERDVDAAIAILDIEDDGVSAYLAPAPDNAQSAIAGRHDAGQIHGPNFEIGRHRHGFFNNGRGQNSRNDDLLPGFEESSGE